MAMVIADVAMLERRPKWMANPRQRNEMAAEVVGAMQVNKETWTVCNTKNLNLPFSALLRCIANEEFRLDRATRLSVSVWML